MLLLERLKLRTNNRLQRIALSATVAHAERLAQWMQGSEQKPVEVISITGGRNLEVSLFHVSASSGEAFLSGESLIRTTQQILKNKKIKKAIIFANTRSICDWIYWRLSQSIRGYQALLHYSSISKEVREHTEERFKRVPMAICIATSTLELGVDIGDVDAVFFYMAPRSISSFVQRVGRANRRSNRVIGCGIIPDYNIDKTPVDVEEEVLLFESLFESTQSHILEKVTTKKLYSVFVQQILSLVSTYEKKTGEAKIDLAPLKRLAHPNLTPFASDEALTELLKGLEDQGFLHRDIRRGYYTFTDQMHDLKDSMGMWSNFSQGLHTPVVTHNTNLSSIPRGNLSRLQVGDAIMVAGKLQVITDISESEIRTSETKEDQNYSKIVYESGEFPAPLELSELCQKVLHQPEETVRCIQDSSLKKRYELYRSRFRDVDLTNEVPFAICDGQNDYYTFLGSIGNSILSLILRDRLGIKSISIVNRLITDSPLRDFTWIPSKPQALHQLINDNYKYFSRLIRPSSHFYRLTEKLKTEEICSYIWSEELGERLIGLREKRLVELSEPDESVAVEYKEITNIPSPKVVALTESSITMISRMRSLVGYLGEKAQHSWWPSAFFSPVSDTFLSPIFPRTAYLARCNGVREAAMLVHDERIGVGQVLHLFRLPEHIEQKLHQAALNDEVIAGIKEDTKDTDSAMGALQGLGDAVDGAMEGPLRIEHVGDVMSEELWGHVAQHYHRAFSESYQTFPYFVEGQR